MSHAEHSDTEPVGWLDRPSTHTLLYRGLIGVCVALVGIEVAFVHGHPHFGFDGIHGFNGVFGFGAFVGVVFLGTQLRKLIMRPEDHYEPQDDTETGEDA